ncbi:hypothetical protein USB125703_00375 [Pseudoclavibacter triregionum]|nr:hypothetical protein USB125703_00375 [Pseudoclavibacter triregionum]
MSDERRTDAGFEEAGFEEAGFGAAGFEEAGVEAEAPIERELPQIPEVELPEINREPVPDRSNAAYLATTPGLEGELAPAAGRGAATRPSGPPPGIDYPGSTRTARAEVEREPAEPAATAAEEPPEEPRAVAEPAAAEPTATAAEPAPAATTPDAPARRRPATVAFLLGVLAAAAAALMLVARGRGLPEQVQTWTALIAGLLAVAGGAMGLRARRGASAAIATALGVLALVAVALLVFVIR